MITDTLKDEIRAFVRENLVFDDRTEIADDASLLDNGVIDSTGVLELVTFLEQRFDVRFADEELIAANFDTIDRMAAFVAGRLA